MSRTVCHFSCGAASAVATKLALANDPRAIIVYCETNAEHNDNERFLKDCEEKFFKKEVTRLSSDKYKDTWDVWERERYLAGVSGAPCTRALKTRPSLLFERPGDRHVFGYTNDKADIARAEAMREHYPELNVRFPLIERGLDKAACLAIVESAGIAVPVTYAMGFTHANCIPCVKARSPSYWALIRKHFPDQFARMVTLSRRLNVPLSKIRGEWVFIDEIPVDHPTTDPTQPACDMLCRLVAEDITE